MYIMAVAVLIICIVLMLQIRNNKNNLKMKIECGETISAKVISWKCIPGKPGFYIIKAEYEIDKKKENKTFVTSRKFAKKYEHDRDIQIVIVPDSNKVFLEEEDWKVQNVWNYIFLIALVSFLFSLLIAGFIEIAVI